MDLNNSKDPPKEHFPPQSHQRKLFRVYRRAEKEIWNERELQRAIKKHIKTFTSIKCQKFHVTRVNQFVPTEIQLSHQKSLVKIIKQNKSYLRSLQLSIQTQQSFHIEIMLPHLKSLRSLSSLTLECTQLQRIPPKLNHSFALSLKHLKQLAHLNHDIYKNLQNSSKSLESFRYLLLLRHLSNLALSFDSSNTLTDQSFHSFPSDLSRVKSLTSLSLNLNNCDGLTKISLSHLFSSVSQLSLLTAFSLQLSHLLIELFQNLKNLPSLEEIALSLSGSGFLTPLVQEPLAAGLSLMDPSSLRRIDLDFDPYFSDSDLSNLLVVLQRFSLLTHFKLEFNRNCRMTGKELSNIHETLRHFPFLRHFSFNKNDDMDACLFLNSLSLCVTNLKHLESLKIMMSSNTNITNLAVQDFSAKLYQCSGLRHLHLNFSGCEKLSDRSLESIAFALRGLENLESLYLNLEQNDLLTNQGVIAFGSSLAQLKDLKTLQLELAYCANIRGENIGSLIASLKHLHCLSELSLAYGDFRDKSDVRNYENLVNDVSKLETLRKINLKIPCFGERNSLKQIDEKARNSSKHFIINWM